MLGSDEDKASEKFRIFNLQNRTYHSLNRAQGTVLEVGYGWHVA